MLRNYVKISLRLSKDLIRVNKMALPVGDGKNIQGVGSHGQFSVLASYRGVQHKRQPQDCLPATKGFFAR